MNFRYLNLIFFTIILVVLSLIIFFSLEDQRSDIKKVSDIATEYLTKLINKDSDNLLSISLALSGNGEIKDALRSDDEIKEHNILKDISRQYNKYIDIDDLKIQVISSDGYLFARSWDSAFGGFPLEWVRDDMDDILRNNQPKSGIELGMFLTIRATTPIFDGSSVIGYIEVIKLLSDVTSELRFNGIELIVLMENRYLKEASLMRDNRVIDNFVVANKNASSIYVKKLSKLSLSLLLKDHYLYKDDILYVMRSMNNTKGKRLGYFVLCLPPNTYNKLSKNSTLLSLIQNDLSYVVDRSKNSLSGFRSYSDRDIINRVSKLNKKDRAIYINRAKEILQDYNKSELIDIIVQFNSKSKKIGEIR